MTKKATIAAATALLIVGVGSLALINRSEPEETPPAVVAIEKRPAPSGRFEPKTSVAAEQPVPEPASAASFDELAEEFGHSRTNLARFVSGNLTDLLEDVLDSDEMFVDGQMAGFGGRDFHLVAALGETFDELALTDAQLEKARELEASARRLQLEEARSVIANLKKDPSVMMEFILVGDALARGEITQQEHDQRREADAWTLDGMINPLNGEPTSGFSFLDEAHVVRDFSALLDADQREVFDKKVSSLQEGAERFPEIHNSNDFATIPPMGLEELDATIESSKKVMAGFKSSMEGFKMMMDGMDDLEREQFNESLPNLLK
jgi:hypothetical protein